MSMKLEKITERCATMGPARTATLYKRSLHKKRSSIMQIIYSLYIIQAINIIALVILWIKVFFYMKGE